MPDPAIRDVQGNYSGTGSVVVTAPTHNSSPPLPDQIVAIMMTRDQGVTWSLPSGFSLLEQQDHSLDSLLSGAVAVKEATGSEPASYTFSHDGAGLGVGVVLLSIQDSAGVAFSDMAEDTGFNATQTSPSVTPTAAGNLILRASLAEREGTTTPYIAPPSGFTEVTELRSSVNRIEIEVSSAAATDTNPTGIAGASSYSNVGETASFSCYSIGLVIDMAGDPTVYLAARAELEASPGASRLFTSQFLATRAVLAADIPLELYDRLQARVILNQPVSAAATVIRRLQVRAILNADALPAMQVTRHLSARAIMTVAASESILGPGYGLTPGSSGSGGGVGSGAGYDQYYDLTSEYREGDEFLAFLPDRGVRGLVGVVRVLARSVRDEDQRQRLDVIQFTPLDEEVFIPRLARGDQIRVRQDRTIQHEFRQFERDTRRRRRWWR